MTPTLNSVAMTDGADRSLARFAADHHGLYRMEDARRFGLTRRQVTHRVRQGRADRVGTGVYRVSGAPRTREQQLLAATWRTRGVASHRSAAEVHGLLPAGRRRPEVTVPERQAHEFTGVTVHRSSDLIDSDVSVVRGIRTTDPTRTLLDLGAVVDGRRLEAIVHQALHRGLTHLDVLAAGYRRISRPGRAGAGPIGALLRDLDPAMGPAESDLEVLLLQILRDHGLPEPVRQHPVDIGGHVVRLDVAYPHLRLFLEGDGFGVHGARTPFEDDRWRQNLLVVHGWWPMRFTWRQLRSRPGEVASQVRRKIIDLTP